ncbi:hypothetical protein F2Q68_00004962 [Brassica cretica]|uniref:Uncharacterized protein n=1 Tax=Brassica cretica TaxID=69181 RepID=A0A8S9JHT0_BRACR|nr:hypothetical protein F2Q68_00004962 [Brassica cretica]
MIFRNEFLFHVSFASRFLVSSGFQGWNLSSDDIGFRGFSGDPEVRPLPIPVGISHSSARKLATIKFSCCMRLLQEATIRFRGCWYG